MLKRLAYLVPRYVVVPQVAFHFDGPNGRHDAYMFEDVGASLSHIPESQLIRSTSKGIEVYRYPLQVAKSIVKQVLEGLKETHSVGIVHNDIGIPNVLVVAEDVNDSPIRDICSKRKDFWSLEDVLHPEAERRPSCLCGCGNFVEDAAIPLTKDSTFKIIDFSHGKSCSTLGPTRLVPVDCLEVFSFSLSALVSGTYHRYSF
jgi:serine/threonine protein kinase